MGLPDLYLFKAARRPLYRKENLHLLAAERGSVVEVAYNRTWVAPELYEPDAIPRGTRVYILFTDRPYELFVPVRQGEVLEAAWDELMLRLRIVLGNWIGVGGDVAAAAPPAHATNGDRADVASGPDVAPDESPGLAALRAFTAVVRAATPARLLPREKFVAPKLDDLRFTAYFDARAEDGWRRAVDNVLAMSRHSQEDPYGRCVFFRPLGLWVNGEAHPDRRPPLSPGRVATLRLGFYNPHLSEDDVAQHELRVLAPEDALAAAAPSRFPATGEVAVQLEVRGPDPTLTVQIGPAPADHTSVTMRFAGARRDGRRDSVWAVREAAVPYGTGGFGDATVLRLPGVTPGNAAVVASRADILRLYDVVQRNAHMHPAAELNILDAFERLLQKEPRLTERRALLLAELGDTERAWHVLHTLDPDLLGDEARLLFFRLYATRNGTDGLFAYVESLDLLAEGRFPRFVEVLTGLSPPVLAGLVPELVQSLPAEQIRDVIDRVATRLVSADAIAETARNLYLATDDAAWAYAFLEERRRTLHLGDRAVIEVLLELAEAGGRLDDVDDVPEEAARRIGNLIELDRIEEARAQLTRACRALRRGERERLYHRVADRLIRKRHYEAAAEALVELAREALRTGDLAEASEAVERAVGVWVEGELDADGARIAAGVGAGAGNAGNAARSGGASGARGVAAHAIANGRAVATLPMWLADAVESVRTAWERCEALVEWRKDEEQRRREALRAKYAGKRILIAGGLRRPEWIERLRDLTGAEVDWAERYRDEGDDLDRFVERIRAGSYACVVHLLQKSGHEVQDRLKRVCEEAGVPFRPAASAGWRGVVEGVAG